MNTRRIPTRRVKENYVHEEIPSLVEQYDQFPQGAQDDQVSIVEQCNNVSVVSPNSSNSDIKEAFLALA